MTSTGEINKIFPVFGHIRTEVRKEKQAAVVLGRDIKPVLIIWAEDPSGAKRGL
jgi:hypothetical protein